MNKLKICRIVTVPLAFVHIKAFLRFLKSKDVEVTLVASAGEYEKVLKQELDINVTHLEISRDINLTADLKSLWSLVLFFRRNKFDIIHSSTPKAGLLVALAGLFTRNSIRLHTFTGQRWATLPPFLKKLLKFFDRIIIKLNTQCYADSFSQIDFLKKEKVVKKDGEVRCLHKGSYGGIDCNRFDNSRFPNARQEILKELNLGPQSILLLFVGRVTREKGIEELVRSFKLAQNNNTHLKLLIIGPFEPELDRVHEDILQEIREHSSIFQLGFRSNPELYFSACDIFCLPSHREGFGTVVMEAAACGLLTLGTRIPGLIDSVVDGQTGMLVELKNVEELERAILELAENELKRKELSSNARKRARSDFDSSFLAEVQWNEYLRLINENKTKSEH